MSTLPQKTEDDVFAETPREEALHHAGQAAAHLRAISALLRDHPEREPYGRLLYVLARDTEKRAASLLEHFQKLSEMAEEETHP